MDFEIRSSHPAYDEDDTEAVNQVLENQYTAEGPEADQLLSELTDRIGLNGGVTTSSGTMAFKLLLEALGVGPGDEVILPAYTCQSLLHPIYQVGAKPRLADVEPDTFSLSRRTVQPHLTERTELVVLVHSFGYPVNDPGLVDLGVPLLEDLAQGIEARYSDGTHVGNRGIAALGSLYATKQLSAGYGGFLLTDDRELQVELDDLKHYDERDDYRPAYNTSLSDLNAALARSQLAKSRDRRSHRESIAQYYDSRLRDVDAIGVPDRPDGHALYRYVVRTPDPDAVIEWMQQRGIEVKRPVFEPLHRTLDSPECETAETLHHSLVLLPLHSKIDKAKARRVLDEFVEFFQ